LTGINNNNAAWEEVSVSCLNGVWCKLLPEFIHDFTGFEPVKDTVEGISRLVQEAGLDKVTGNNVAQMLDNHGKQLSNEYVEEMAKEISQQKEEEKEKDEKPPLKCMKKCDLQYILSGGDPH
jgi:hypothetical protein